MLRALRLRLSNARAEEKKARLRVRRLEAQVETVSKQLGGRPTSAAVSGETPAPAGGDSGYRGEASSHESAPRAVDSVGGSKFSVIDTSIMSMLPEGWSSAVDQNTGKTYFYNDLTGAVQWTAPSGGSFDLRPQVSVDMRNASLTESAAQPAHAAPSVGSEANRAAFLPQPAPTEKPAHTSVFDRLTDHRFYTGAHKSRFDEDGKGKALHSPRKMGQRGTHFNVSSTYKGNTNTGTNEKFQCTSEFLVRNVANAGRWNNEHKGDAWKVRPQTHLIL